jgi:hypothetical protein
MFIIPINVRYKSYIILIISIFISCISFLCGETFFRKFIKLKYIFMYYDWDTGWTIGVLGFDSRRELGIFIFTTASRTALGPTQPPIQGVPGALSLGVKRPGREADNSPPSSAEVKNAWSCTSTPPNIFKAWCLVKHRDNFTFTFMHYKTRDYVEPILNIQIS